MKTEKEKEKFAVRVAATLVANLAPVSKEARVRELYGMSMLISAAVSREMKKINEEAAA